MDIDYVADTSLSPDDIVKIVTDIHQVVPGKCLVATAPPKPKDGFTKSGIHIVWPDLAVDKQKALQLMNTVKETVASVSSYIDDSVYKGSGFRMIWSHKKGKNGDEDPYVPFYNVSTGKFISQQQPNVTAVKMFSIRIGDSCKNVDTVTEYTDVEVFLYTCVKEELRYRGFQSVQPDAFVVSRIINDPSASDIFYIQTQSRFCMHKMSFHKSNHVYFVLDTNRKVLYQKCFDDECKKYKGTMHKVPCDVLKKITS
jgi:hypothetical protein